jgi:uncharacterized protein (TIGR02271 family)
MNEHRSSPSQSETGRTADSRVGHLDVLPGATVVASDGPVGTVERIVTDPATGATTAVTVRTETDGLVDVPITLFEADASSGGWRLLASRASLTSGMTALQEVGDHLVVPVHEEVLVPVTHEVEVGQVRINKRVEEVEVETRTDRRHDEVSIERVAINRPIDAVPGARNEGDTLVIPVLEEVLVTEKRLMLKEEIRVTRRRVVEQVPVRGTVRREVVEFDETVAPEAPATNVPRG